MNLQPIRVLLHVQGSNPIFSGLTDGDRWNGWRTPRFPLEEAKRIAEWTQNPDIFDPENNEVLTYDAARGVFVGVDGTYVSDDEDGITIYEPDADGLFWIGTYGWCWEEADAEDEATAPR